MKIKVVERKVAINDKTREKLENKLLKFNKLLGESAEAVATFKTQKDKIFLEISIRSDDMIIRAESSDPDAKIAIEFLKIVLWCFFCVDVDLGDVWTVCFIIYLLYI